MPAPTLRAPDPFELPGSNLFPDEIMDALTDEERKFALYTGARCPKQKREAIITLLAEGRAIDYIRRLVAVHRETVLNVANEFAVEIADYERRMPAKLKRTKWSLVDRIEREIDSLPRQSLGLTLKIVSDIEALDSGRAIARVDHVHRIDLFSDFGEFVRQLETRPAIDEKNGAGNHSSGGNKALMPGDAPAAAAIDVEAEQIDEASLPCHWKSDVLGLPTQASPASVPTFSPDLVTAAADSAELETAAAEPDPAGGGLAAAAATDLSMDKGSQKFLDNGL